MAADRAAWLAVMQQDAERLAQLLRAPAVTREQRQAARALLWQAFALLEAAAGEAEAQPTEPALQQTLRDLEQLRKDLGDLAPHGIRALHRVWIRSPLPERLLLPAASRATAHLTRAVERHFAAAVALTPQRMAWFEKRCAQADPTRVAVVRQPEDAKTSRLSGSEVVLLVKKGPSRFS